MRLIDADELLARMRERCDSCPHNGNREYCLNLCEWREAMDEVDDMPEIEMNVSAGVHHCAGDDGQTAGGLRQMNEAIKSITYVEGFLTALGAVMQDREMPNETPGRITTETQYAVKRLRDVEACIKGMDCMIDSRNEDAKNYEAEIKELQAKVEVMREASERTERIAYWIDDFGIPTGNPGEYTCTWKCSNCGKIYTAKTAYCPGCGARMEVSGDV